MGNPGLNGLWMLDRRGGRRGNECGWHWADQRLPAALTQAPLTVFSFQSRSADLCLASTGLYVHHRYSSMLHTCSFNQFICTQEQELRARPKQTRLGPGTFSLCTVPSLRTHWWAQIWFTTKMFLVSWLFIRKPIQSGLNDKHLFRIIHRISLNNNNNPTPCYEGNAKTETTLRT